MPNRPKTNEEFLAGLRTNPAYAHIDIDIELARAATWCEVNNRQNTPRFFVNWLNRIQQPLAPTRPPDPGRPRTTPIEPDYKPCPFCGKIECLNLHDEERRK